MDLYAEVTNRIVAELEKGVAPWNKPWKSIGTRSPHNAATRRPYSGVNALLLWIDCLRRGWSNPGFLTFKQAKEAGGHVRKGEKATQVVLLKPVEKREETEDGEEITTRWIMRAFYVFNVDQCQGLPAKFYETPKLPTVELDSEFQAWVRRTGARIVDGPNACYRPGLDLIEMPPAGAFISPSHYADTLLHELGHWTGHESRLNRDLSKRFGTETYAMEELVAELTSAFLCAEFGIDGHHVAEKKKSDHASYIATWITVLQNDKRAIFTAASSAQKAADYLKDIAAAKEERKAA